VWIEDKEQGAVGSGLVPLASTWEKLFDWAKSSARSSQPTLMVFDSSGMGDKADEARRWGLNVIGGGSFCDKLEKDRSFGFEIAKAAGALLPDYKDFQTFAEARSWADSLPEDADVYWKSDRFLESDATHSAHGGAELREYLDSVIRRFGSRGECMVQDKIDGIALSTARWWNGKAFIGPVEGTIEHKKCWNEDIGPSTGCAFNSVWFYPDNEPDIAVALGFDKLTYLFAKYSAPPGIYDVNAVVDEEGQAYFLEWTPRFGYDAEPTAFELWGSASGLLWAVATGTTLPEWSDQLAYSMRLTIPPYPWEHGKREMKHTSFGVEVRGLGVANLVGGNFLPYELAFDESKGLHVASAEGVVGLAAHVGDSLSALHNAALETAESIRVSGLQYRTDGDLATADDAEALMQAGFSVPRGLME